MQMPERCISILGHDTRMEVRMHPNDTIPVEIASSVSHCCICGRGPGRWPLRRGRCAMCHEYWRTHDTDRPLGPLRLPGGDEARTLARFWSHVTKSDSCWLWTGGRYGNGYGRIFVNGHMEPAHRYAYQLTHGAISNGQRVRHTCDTPLCVRNDGDNAHLILGTQADNIHDMVERKRHVYGERSPHAKLTWDAVRRMRAAAAVGTVSMPALALEYGVSRAAIRHVLSGRQWKELDS
jgi:hypothetical protein